MVVDQEDTDDAQDKDNWFCSEAQALPVVVESLDVFAAHLTSKVRSTCPTQFGVFFSGRPRVCARWWPSLQQYIQQCCHPAGIGVVELISLVCSH